MVRAPAAWQHVGEGVQPQPRRRAGAQDRGGDAAPDPPRRRQDLARHQAGAGLLRVYDVKARAMHTVYSFELPCPVAAAVCEESLVRHDNEQAKFLSIYFQIDYCLFAPDFFCFAAFVG